MVPQDSADVYVWKKKNALTLKFMHVPVYSMSELQAFIGHILIFLNTKSGTPNWGSIFQTKSDNNAANIWAEHLGQATAGAVEVYQQLSHAHEYQYQHDGRRHDGRLHE